MEILIISKIIYFEKRFSKKIICAASTHKKEELFIAKVHKELKSEIKNLITIIIPRHINGLMISLMS